MKQIVFATHNKDKLFEVRNLLAGRFDVLGLHDINCYDEIPETSDTLEENAQQKSSFIYEQFGYDCFADDTGLEIEAIGMKPGVLSARYAGEPTNSENNMNKVLAEMVKLDNRKARFRTVVSLVRSGEYHNFEGIVEGEISYTKQGAGGFGYDPIFIPDGYDASFAELPLEVKNKISHRARAIEKLIKFLNSV